MLRFENKVPAVYVRESRDFQLFIAVLDYMQNATKWRVDEIAAITDTSFLPDSLLRYLKTKLGYISVLEFSESYLRYLLRVFSYAVRTKGSKVGILTIVNAFLNAQKIISKVDVSVTNDSGDLNMESYVVNIQSTEVIPNKHILENALEFVIPAGYRVKYNLLIDRVYSGAITVRSTQKYNHYTKQENSQIANAKYPVEVHIGDTVVASADKPIAPLHIEEEQDV